MFVKPLTTGESIFKPPFSKKLKVGYVTLQKNQEIGEHTTTDKEEVLFIIEGTANVKVANEQQEVTAGHLIYIPPETLHNIVNHHSSPLKYLYLVGLL